MRTCQLTRILNSSPACQKICLFTRISTFSHAFLPYWVFLSKKFEEALNKSSAINKVKCRVYHSNCEPTLRQCFFHFLCKKKGKKPYRWGCVEKKLLEPKHLLDWTNHLVKKHFKLTDFSLLRTLAEIPAFVSIIS